MDADLLSIYLRDHLGGAMGGLELARRAVRSNRGTEFGPDLERLANEIAEDRETLREVMQRLGVKPNPVKVAGGWAAEKVGRLKPNGRLRGYSPLSRVVELEALVVGVRAKQALWAALGQALATDSRVAGVDFAGLARRAGDQVSDLERWRLRAAAIAFGGDSPGP